MQRARVLKHCSRFALPLVAMSLTIPTARADSCSTQTQIPASQRQELSRVARNIVGEVQSGNIQGLRSDTLAAVAADFGGIQTSAQTLAPLIQPATITVDALFAFEAAQQPQGGVGSQFFCSAAGSPMTVVLNFSTLPPAKYALAIVHATGVPKPQQITLILAQTPDNQWKLAGFFVKPMMLAGQNGLWYWSRARDYAQKNMDWDAWFYYQTAAFLVSPADFISSPNMDKLRGEADKVRPQDLPLDKPITVKVSSSAFAVTKVDTSIELGPLDLAIHYSPNDTQATQLRDPVAARKQVIDLMAAMLALHPELRTAFHGVYVYADAASATVFALELPMDQIPNGATSTVTPGSAGQ